MQNNNKLWIIDSTLRDGEQAPGVNFSKKEKLHLASILDDIGIDEIEAGIPAMGKEAIDTIRSIVQLNLAARILVWSRALKKDIDQAIQSNAEAIHLAFPVSDIQLDTMHKDWQWVKDNVPEMIAYASRHFKYVSVGAQDASRCDTEQLLEFISLAVQSGAYRLRLADTVGFLTPLTTINLIQSIKTFFPLLNLDFHAHNDLGMATANSVTAWQCGANSISLTVNGLGERAGNAALEEFLMTVSLHHKANRYKISSLFSLCQYVAEISGRPISVDKAISGEMVLSHESGIHVNSTLQNPLAFQLYNGETIGRETCRNVFGTHSGTGALKQLLSQHHIFASETEIELLKKKIACLAVEKRRNIMPAEIPDLYFKMTSKSNT